MPARARAAGLSDLLQELRAEVEPYGPAAWIVDPLAARLFPLNDNAQGLYPVADARADDGTALDSAMPAIAALRRLLRTPKRHRSDDKPHWLLFWTEHGPRRILCNVRIVVSDHGLFCLVRSVHEIAHQFPTPAARQPEKTKDAGPVIRDDAATLREIARQIRAGASGDLQEPAAAAPAKRRAPRPVTREDSGETAEAAGQPAPSRRRRRRPGDQPDPALRFAEARRSENRSAVAVSRRQRAPDQEPNALQPKTRLAELAHELRTPLSAILSASEILKDERLGVLENFRYRGYARDIYQTAANALSLLERIFDEARGSAPDSQREADPSLSPEDLDLNQLAEHCLATVRHLAPAKNLTLTLQLHPTAAHVRADRVMASQIVINLLTNAIKFTPDGGEIELRVVETPDLTLAVEVEDFGPGLSAAELARLLDPDSTLRPSRRQGGGLGIGLALSRQLADRMGAILSLQSEAGVGTKATLVFANAARH